MFLGLGPSLLLDETFIQQASNLISKFGTHMFKLNFAILLHLQILILLLPNISTSSSVSHIGDIPNDSFHCWLYHFLLVAISNWHH